MDVEPLVLLTPPLHMSPSHSFSLPPHSSQARMDVEPLVLLQQRPVSLAPLAAGLPQLSHLALADAAFSRHPWGLGQLAGCGGLRGLSLAWDTGLWAPGQVLQEGLALQVIGGAVICLLLLLVPL